jgi:hypothetical protein
MRIFVADASHTRVVTYLGSGVSCLSVWAGSTSSAWA